MKNDDENVERRNRNGSALELPSVFVELEKIEVEAQRRAAAILEKNKNSVSLGYRGVKSHPSKLGGAG